jgi:hypothetical protein
MNKGEIYALWAPLDAPWTPWVKPVLFSALEHETSPAPLGPLPTWLEAGVIAPLQRHSLEARRDQAPYRRSPALDDVAIVVDLPGAEGALVGVALAHHGFRPIPLYNAMTGPSPVVDLKPIMAVLVNAAPDLAALPPRAPPVFLLDERRMGRGLPREIGYFDNRSVCFPTDFPSASTLRSAGIRRAVLIQAGGELPAIDLAEALVPWQEAGITFLVARADTADPAAPRFLTRPSWLRRFLHGFERRGLFSNASGVFGGLLQLPQGQPSQPSAG